MEFAASEFREIERLGVICCGMGLRLTVGIKREEEHYVLYEEERGVAAEKGTL